VLNVIVFNPVFPKLLFHRPLFILDTSLSPPSLIKQTQGCIFKSFHLKKSIHTMVPS